MQPQPTVIGASDVDLGELQGLTAKSQSWPHQCSVDELVATLFGCLADLAANEEQKVVATKRDTTAKQNRRNAYLELEKRCFWEAQSQKFLRIRSDVVHTLPLDALYCAVAMQHLLALDAMDMHLSADQRCSDDAYTEGVSDQFLLDATRGRYSVDGRLFHYAESHEQETEKTFMARLLDAVGTLVPSEMLPCVSSAMSQSGLAALERSSMCSIAVSGGIQDVDYMLAPNSDELGGVLVKLQVFRKGFTAYMKDENVDEPLSCDSASSIRKAATVTYGVDGTVHVIDFMEEINVLQGGELLPLETLFRPVSFRQARQQGSSHRICAQARECMRRAVRCTDRCRGARQSRDDA